jgi:uncharacterized membrane protein YkvA (DUF1232 family)
LQAKGHKTFYGRLTGGVGQGGAEQILQRIKEWARAIRRDVHALWLAARDPRTPWYAKAFALAIAAYALSPIDLIPDFIPVIGYLAACRT